MDTSINAGSYSVFIGESVLSELDIFLKQDKFSNSSFFILCDENSERYCLSVLLSKAGSLAKAVVIRVKGGEQHKNIDTCKHIWEKLEEHRADRNSLLINLGGGVIGDMGGFAASVFKRGIRFIQVPTTLLAQVDASVGGKLGIDFNNLKNEIGVFNNPEGVFIYPPVLKTLDKRQLLSGFAEMIKHALIADIPYFEQLKKISSFEIDEKWEALIARSVSIKNKIVQADPAEKNIRKALNFGHTIGHALESIYLEKGSDLLLHGEAIAIGMIAEGRLSVKCASLPENDFRETEKYIFSLFPKINLDAPDQKKLLERMKQDKKNISGKINFTLLKKPGEYAINCKCDEKDILESLDYYYSST